MPSVNIGKSTNDAQNVSQIDGTLTGAQTSTKAAAHPTPLEYCTDYLWSWIQDSYNCPYSAMAKISFIVPVSRGVDRVAETNPL